MRRDDTRRFEKQHTVSLGHFEAGHSHPSPSGEPLGELAGVHAGVSGELDDVAEPVAPGWVVAKSRLLLEAGEDVRELANESVDNAPSVTHTDTDVRPAVTVEQLDELRKVDVEVALDERAEQAETESKTRRALLLVLHEKHNREDFGLGRET